MEELRRRMASAKSWGVEGCRLVTPAEIKELVPFVDESILLGGFYTPSVAVVDSLRFGTIMRERAQAKGAQVFANTEVLGIDVEDGRVRRVRTIARRLRGGRRRDRVRRLVAAHRAHGRRVDPAHARGAPDDRRRPGAALPHVEDGGRLPDRARHGHEHVRAPGRAGARGRLVRAPADPPRARRDPVDRGGVADADRAAVHAGGLRAAARARARARAGDPRRRVGRHQVRDQRPALADARRAAAARRDARGEGALVGRGGVGEGRARASAASVAEWMVHGESEIDLQSSDIARFYPRAAHAAST